MFLRNIFLLLCLFFGVALQILAVPLGVFSFSKPSPTVSYVIDSLPVVLDSGIVLYRQNAVPTTVTNWGGGTVLFTLSSIASGANLDRLACAPTNPSITWAYDTSTRVLTITAPNTVPFADLQSALRTVTFSTSGMCTATRSVTVTIAETGFGYYATNGHYYMKSGDLALSPVSAATASINAGTLSNYGYKGYIATITNAGENSFIATLTGGSTRYFIGASDTVAGGNGGNTYRWMSGPEYGQVLTYTNWNGGQPDNDSGNDAIEINYGSAGRWNDLPQSNTWPYVLEFGGLASDSPNNVLKIQVTGVNSLMMLNPF